MCVRPAPADNRGNAAADRRLHLRASPRRSADAPARGGTGGRAAARHAVPARDRARPAGIPVVLAPEGPELGRGAARPASTGCAWPAGRTSIRSPTARAGGTSGSADGPRRRRGRDRAGARRGPARHPDPRRLPRRPGAERRPRRDAAPAHRGAPPDDRRRRARAQRERAASARCSPPSPAPPRSTSTRSTTRQPIAWARACTPSRPRPTARSRRSRTPAATVPARRPMARGGHGRAARAAGAVRGPRTRRRRWPRLELAA